MICLICSIYVVFIAFEFLSKFLDVYNMPNFLKTFHFYYNQRRWFQKRVNWKLQVLENL